MEDYQQLIIVGAGLQNMGSKGPPYHLFTEAVLLDRTNPKDIHPILYQIGQSPLADALVSPSIHDYLAMQDNAFILMGKVIEVDRKAKIIHLADGHTVSYVYLVTVSGADFPYSAHDYDREFTPGLQTLVDAIKLHQQFRDGMESGKLVQALDKDLHFGFVGIDHPSSNIKQLALQTMHSRPQSSNPSRPELHGNEARFFQVQI